ncbi:MAG TPA: flagellar cap protein FliD N-terminal domain-containing protein, partial [Tepidisphaeraceae bacterium]|nr:flagellar cap protein FliD N-terminal domain-containing protein [Tepidisphaeraceae bacterium]
MGQITSSIGLVSGINTGAIISELLQLDQVPVTVLQTKINSANSQTKAYADLQTDLQTLQTTAQSLQLPQTFLASTTNSSNSNVLTATAGAGAPEGSYQFQVAQLVSAQQSISNGYTSPGATMQAGSITLTLGGGNLNAQTNLSDLNGGAGVSRGQFRITDRGGQSDVIDTSNDVTLDDVVKQINNALSINVQASIQGNKLVLTDGTGGSGTLSVKDIAGGSAAQSLGIAGSASGSSLTGSAINYVSSATALSALNDGRGIRLTSGSGDFSVTAGDGSSFTVNLASSQTVGDVLNAINTASGGKVKASIGAGATGITLADQTTGTGGLSVSDINGSHAAEDLGIQQTAPGGTITGSAVLAGLDTVLVSSLKGGTGIQLGQINITDRQGHTTAVNLSGAKTVQDILDTINNATGGTVSASLDAATNGIQLQDTTGGAGNLTIADANGGTTAQSLGIAGTFNASQAKVDGGDLHLQFVSQGTLLSNYNGGKGVGTGKFQITNSAGVSATIDMSQGTFNTIGDVIGAINAKNIGVTASINANGNGILLTDSSSGAGPLTVKDVTGTS